MAIRVEVEVQPAGRVQVRMVGRLDTEGAAACEPEVERVLAGSARVVIFDLAGVSFITSMGLRLLFMAQAKMRKRDGEALIVNLQPPVAKVFEIVAALPTDGVFASRAEADAYLAAMQHREAATRGGGQT